MSSKIEDGKKVLLNLKAGEWKEIQEEANQYSLSGAALIRLLITKHLKEKGGANATARLI